MSDKKTNKGISRREFIESAAAGAAMLALGAGLSGCNKTTSKGAAGTMSVGKKGRPNILFITTDQQRFDTIASLGNKYIRTRNMNRLVSEGVTFTKAFTQATVCTPSRASFMTGRYPHNTGARGNGFDIRENEVTLPKMLRDGAGYDCGLVGKLHLSSCDGHVEHRIDDGYRIFEWSQDPFPSWKENEYTKWLRSKGYEWKDLYKPIKGAAAYAGVPVELHQTTWCFNEAIKIIEKNELAKPWCLSLNVFAPHHPFDPSPEYFKRYDPAKMPLPKYKEGELDNKPFNQMVDHSKGGYGGREKVFTNLSQAQQQQVTAAYYAMIEQVDDQLGRILDVLDKSGQMENTIIVFTSDHGEMLGDHGIYLKGGYPYDALIHVPLVFSWKGHFMQGLQSDALVELVDIVPTLLDAVNEPIPAGVQGRSLYGICTGKADQHHHRDHVFTEFYAATKFDEPNISFSMIRDRKFKITVYHGLDVGELYDLESDPDEFNNLWNDPAHQQLKNELVKKCFDATVATADPLPLRRGYH